MTLTYNKPTIVALLDKPSSESFGMLGIIVNSQGRYHTLGLPKNGSVSKIEFEMLQGHILEVNGPLPKDLVNPVALWLGSEFQTKATELKAPALPTLNEHWRSPLEPNERRGKYTIKESAEAYKILDEWVTETAREALVRNDYDLAVLTRWTLPMHPATKAALYYAAPASEKKRELDWQLRTERKVSAEQLIQEHEKVRSQLLERKE